MSSKHSEAMRRRWQDPDYRAKQEARLRGQSKAPVYEPRATSRPYVTLRSEVRRFARAMEMRLRANDHKPGWKADSPEALLDRVDEELLELHMAVAANPGKTAILLEAADVANFLMMVVDVCGQLVDLPSSSNRSKQ
jgi:NTP pyrophosphatase (non-canonical NTP hydrolase)